MYPNDQVQVNVKDFLNNPSRVERVLNDLTKDKTIADYAFGQGDAKHGAVVYDEVTGHPVESNRDVEIIAPGAEFPLINVLEEEQKMAKVDKYGGAAGVTFEAIRRNDGDVLNKRLQVLKNLIIAKVNAVAVNALIGNANINTHVLTTDWSVTTTDPIADLFAAQALIDDNELGYKSDLYLVNPVDAQRYLLGRKDVREQVQKEGEHPVLSGDLGKLAGGEWIKSSKVPAGEIFVLQ